MRQTKANLYLKICLDLSVKCWILDVRLYTFIMCIITNQIDLGICKYIGVPLPTYLAVGQSKVNKHAVE